MQNKDKCSVSNRYEYTVINYDLCKSLSIKDFKTFIVLDAMLFFSKKNTFNCSQSGLANLLCIDRKTLKEHILRLHANGHIKDKDKKRFYLNEDLKYRFEKDRGTNYLIVYHRIRYDLGLEIKECALLYLYYTLSRRTGYAFASVKFYSNKLGIEQRQYYNLRSTLMEKEYIDNIHGKNKVSLRPYIVEKFDERVKKIVQ